MADQEFGGAVSGATAGGSPDVGAGFVGAGAGGVAIVTPISSQLGPPRVLATRTRIAPVCADGEHPGPRVDRATEGCALTEK
jgi:hypothetical protein